MLSIIANISSVFVYIRNILVKMSQNYMPIFVHAQIVSDVPNYQFYYVALLTVLRAPENDKKASRFA